MPPELLNLTVDIGRTVEPPSRAAVRQDQSVALPLASDSLSGVIEASVGRCGCCTFLLHRMTLTVSVEISAKWRIIANGSW